MLTCWRRIAVLTGLHVMAAAVLSPGCGGVERRVFVGDSITSNGTLPELSYSELIPGGQNWAEGGTNTEWWAHGVPGVTGPLIEQIAPAMPAHEVWIMLGTNDSTGFLLPGGPTTPTRWRENVEILVDWCMANGAGRVVLAMAPKLRDSNGVERQGPNALMEQYGDQAELICAARPDVVCGPFFYREPDTWDPRIRDFQAPDWLHPSIEGQAHMATVVMQWIQDNGTTP